MTSTAAVQKHAIPGPAAADPEFGSAFYRPYKSAAETAFLILDRARAALSLQCSRCSVSEITFRLKSPASIRGKLLKKGLPVSSPAAGACLQDVAGMRVILSGVGAVYRYAQLIRETPFAECIGEDDYIAHPKASGYRSLHLVLRVPVCVDSACLMVPVEIQLRTKAMDEWACAEHKLCYKPSL